MWGKQKKTRERTDNKNKALHPWETFQAFSPGGIVSLTVDSTSASTQMPLFPQSALHYGYGFYGGQQGPNSFTA